MKKSIIIFVFFLVLILISIFGYKSLNKMDYLTGNDLPIPELLTDENSDANIVQV